MKKLNKLLILILFFMFTMSISYADIIMPGSVENVIDVTFGIITLFLFPIVFSAIGFIILKIIRKKNIENKKNQ